MVLLDSVDANWFDESRREQPGPLADGSSVDEADRNVSVLELRTSDFRAFVGEPFDTSWLELELASASAGEPLVLHYLNLFGRSSGRS